MDFSTAIITFEVAGNKLWRIIALFGVILIALVLGRVAKFILQKAAIKFENQKRFMTATALNGISRGVVFLFAAFGISLGLAFLELKSKVAEV